MRKLSDAMNSDGPMRKKRLPGLGAKQQAGGVKVPGNTGIRLPNMRKATPVKKPGPGPVGYETGSPLAISAPAKRLNKLASIKPRGRR